MCSSHAGKTGQTAPRRLLIISIIAGIAALAAVTATLDHIGITWDEPNYYRSCLKQIEWFSQAFQDFSSGQWSAPFSPEVLDSYWDFSKIYNHIGAHPQFYLLCNSISLALFEPWLGTMGAYRLAPAIMFSLLVSLIFWTAGRRYGIAAGLWAAGSFALLPRIFGHAHIGATDMPMTVLWFASAASFHRALESRKWAPVFALVYGLALATKFTAFVIPLPLVLFVLLSRRFKEAAWPVGIALVVSPLVMIGLNPQWWHSTLERVYSYLTDNAARSDWVRIPTYYLGKKYNFYLPWHHSLVLTLFTVPPMVLAGFLCGFWRTVHRLFKDQWATHMLLHWLILQVVMMLPSSPGHDGVRLFLPSFAFLAVISAKGFYHFTSEAIPWVVARLSRFGQRTNVASAWLLLGAMVVPATVVLVRVHPYELCYYNSLAGGIPGARDLGMETTYWWDPINDEACKLINETVSDSAVVSTRNNGLFVFLQQLGRIKPSLKFHNEKQSDYILLYNRQSIFGDHHWVLYRRGTPQAQLRKDGVQLMAIFKIPEDLRPILNELIGSKDVESHYQTALVYTLMGKPDSLFPHLKEYLEHRPEDFKATMLMVYFCLENNFPDKVLEYLERVDNAEDPMLWHYTMGQAYYQMGETDRAIACFQQSLKYQSRHPLPISNIAYIYSTMGRLEEAAEHYERVLSIQPYDEKALNMMGVINQDLNRYELARYYFNRLLGEKPRHLLALLNMGLLERSEGRSRKAEEFFLRALEVDSTNAQARFNLANLLEESGKTALAEKHYKIILKENPNDSLTHSALALLYLKDPSHQTEALEHFRILAKLVSEQADLIDKQYIIPLQVKIAQKYFESGRLEEAAEQYEILLNAQPNDEDILYMLGLINHQLNKSNRAKYYYNRLLKKNPRQLATLVNMGMIEKSEGRPEKAKEYYNRALALDSTDISANFNLANLLMESGDTRLAERHYKVVLGKQPEDSQTNLALALLYLKDPSRHSEALEHFRILVRLMPERAEYIEKRYIKPLQKSSDE